jgi:hypothetical protein
MGLLISAIKSILSDKDGILSSKRVILLWVGIIIWSGVHIVVFKSDTMSRERLDLINDDFWLIVSSGRLVLAEKFTKNNT